MPPSRASMRNPRSVRVNMRRRCAIRPANRRTATPANQTPVLQSHPVPPTAQQVCTHIVAPTAKAGISLRSRRAEISVHIFEFVNRDLGKRVTISKICTLIAIWNPFCSLQFNPAFAGAGLVGAFVKMQIADALANVQVALMLAWHKRKQCAVAYLAEHVVLEDEPLDAHILIS